jgi:hypothetical protein
MKRLLAVLMLLGLAAPALASDTKVQGDQRQLAASAQPVAMTDAEFDGVVAGGNAYAYGHAKKNAKSFIHIVNSVIIFQIAVGNTGDVDQIAVVLQNVKLNGLGGMTL